MPHASLGRAASLCIFLSLSVGTGDAGRSGATAGHLSEKGLYSVFGSVLRRRQLTHRVFSTFSKRFSARGGLRALFGSLWGLGQLKGQWDSNRRGRGPVACEGFFLTTGVLAPLEVSIFFFFFLNN